MVDTLIPGPESQWPKILKCNKSEDQVEIEMAISADLEWFKGHYPEHPVLPGVVQLFWAEQLGQHFYPEFAELKQLKNIKFNQMILPGAQVTLTLAMDSKKRRLKFQFQQDGHNCSSGTLVEVNQ